MKTWIKTLLTHLMLIITSIGFFTGAHAAPDVQSEWKLEYNDSQTVIYTRPLVTDSSKASDYFEVKSEVKIEAPLSAVLPFFQGKDGCWQWQLKCKSSVILEKVSEYHQVVYTVVNMPWPITDRDFVFDANISEYKLEAEQVELTETKKAQTEKIVIRLAPHPKPELYNKAKSKLVRATSNIVYELRSTSAGKTQLNIYMHTDFSGSVSPKLINNRLAESLSDDINALLHLINERFDT